MLAQNNMLIVMSYSCSHAVLCYRDREVCHPTIPASLFNLYSWKYRNRAGLNDWIYEKSQREGSA
jgi:hypothetical protein